MNKLVVFKIGEGNFANGFPLILQIGEEGKSPSTEMTGQFPPAPEIPELYKTWQSIYRRLGGMESRITISDTEVTNISIRADLDECYNQAQILRHHLNLWLRQPTCLEWRERVLFEVKRDDLVRVILQTQNLQLRQLPWHLWDLFERYPQAEIALSANHYHCQGQGVTAADFTSPLKILAILGNSDGIDVKKDQEFLQGLSATNITWLEQPPRQHLNDHLWQQNWDILFFAGHSATLGEEVKGVLQINGTESLTIEQLKYALTRAVEQGLKLAIFNSCEGLGLAHNLADVNIPQVIVMREPVPDRVAHTFLKYFLETFSQGTSCYQSVRTARERLQGLEHQFPCATWLPIICQNLGYAPLSLVLENGNKAALKKNEVDNLSRPPVPVPVPVPPSPIANPQLSRQECRYRQILLSKVKNYWIKGVLETSLHGRALIELGLEERLDALDHPWGLMWESSQQNRQLLPHGTRVTEKFDELGAGRTLLILGEPGSGKTTTLLELTQDLMTRAELDFNLVIPVVFNLSSWKNSSQNNKALSFEDWLLKELYTKYQVSREISRNWIQEQQLLLLLDGLDEVGTKDRPSCVAAINQFLQKYGQTEMVVCCRRKDYESLSTRLRLIAAIYLQPLTPEQIQNYLTRIGDDVAAVRAALTHDATLQELAKSPLILSIMTLAYQGMNMEELPQMDLAERRRHLFNTYIDRMFSRRVAGSPYSKTQAKHWLIKLAKQMVSESQTVFLIERIQPSWLKTKLQKIFYSFGVALIGGLVAGLGVGYSVAIISGTQIGLMTGLILGLSGGIGGGLILILVITQIEPVETLKWSWEKARINCLPGLRIGLLAGIVYMVGVALLMRIAYGLKFNLISLLSFGLSGLNIGIMFILLRGLTGGDIETSTIPNQGIWMSARNSLFFATIGVVTLAATAKLAGYPLRFGAIAGLVLGLFSPATIACTQHFSLRVVLYLHHYIPWNYAKFLDYATGLIFLQKVGGGYIFIHRLLLEHFAQMASERS